MFDASRQIGFVVVKACRLGLNVTLSLSQRYLCVVYSFSTIVEICELRYVPAVGVVRCRIWQGCHKGRHPAFRVDPSNAVKLTASSHDTCALPKITTISKMVLTTEQLQFVQDQLGHRFSCTENLHSCFRAAHRSDLDGVQDDGNRALAQHGIKVMDMVETR